MTHKTKLRVAKLIYGSIFLVLLPVYIWVWAMNIQHVVLYPRIQSTLYGFILIALAMILMLWGMIALIRYGKGLPMIAFPPVQFVHNGPYRITSHPIYWGFAFLIAGLSIYYGSKAGLWLITPIVVLSLVALVLGYEKIDLENRFPNKRLLTFLSLPDSSPDHPKVADLINAQIHVFGLLFLGNYLSVRLFNDYPVYLEKSLHLNSYVDSPLLVVLVFCFVMLSPFLIQSNKKLIEWTYGCLTAMAIVYLLNFLLPSVGMSYFPKASIHDAFPGLDILSTPLSLILICIFSIPTFRKGSPYLFGFTIGIIILLHFVNSRAVWTDAIISLPIALIGFYHKNIGSYLIRLSEKIANSWKEWVFGNVRIINHGFYIGIASFLGLMLSGYLAGSEQVWYLLLFASIVIVCAALWAQLLEGSDRLKRPFGYYGSMVGILVACGVLWLLKADIWMVLGAATVSMPWMQAIGRLRCLVNGCCHGKITENTTIGIRYYHVRSRVCTLSNLKGEYLHPTPLYSSFWLLLVGLILLSLWFHQQPPSFILGLYLILSGIGRFVEEAYRGEVQTKIIGGLRIYQWMAILSLLIGILVTMIPTMPILADPQFSIDIVSTALIGGIIGFILMGVDFPYSNSRFARLT